MINLKILKELYNKAKSAKVGEECLCPSCKTKFTKSSYQQVFCKTKTGTKCKDFYWNNITPEKRCNTTRISPANAIFQLNNFDFNNISNKSKQDREDKRELELEDDGSWDSHQCSVARCEYCEYLICQCVD